MYTELHQLSLLTVERSFLGMWSLRNGLCHPPKYGNSSWSLTAGSSPRYQRSPNPLGKRRPIRIPTLAQVPASLRSWTCQKTKSLLPMFTPWGHAAAPDAQSVSSSLNVDRLGRAVFKNRRSAGEK